MLKSLLGAAALPLSMLGVVACSQGPNEEAGEAADTNYEQSTTGTTDLGQGPAEETGEALDEAADGVNDGWRHDHGTGNDHAVTRVEIALRLNSLAGQKARGEFSCSAVCHQR